MEQEEDFEIKERSGLNLYAILKHINDYRIFQYFLELILTTPITQLVFSIIFAYYSIIAIFYIYRTFLRPSKDLYKRYNGGWAVITGASEGIGYQYALNLAQKGFNLILIARDEKKLKFKVQEIKKVAKKVDIQFISFDFNVWYSPETYKALTDKIEEISSTIAQESINQTKGVSVLVNCVALLSFKPFEEYTHEEIDQSIKVNALSFLHLSRFLIPKFLKRDRRSLIVNVGAGFGTKTFPGFWLYGGCKSIMNVMSQGLAEEYKHKIDILTSIPGPVYSDLVPKEIKIPLAIPASQHVKETLRVVGYETMTHSSYKHDLMVGIFINWRITAFMINKDFNNWKEINKMHETYQQNGEGERSCSS